MSISLLERPEIGEETLSTDEYVLEQAHFQEEITEVERDFASEDEDGNALGKAIFAYLVSP